MFLLLLFACTENERAKTYGGSMEIDLPCGTQLTEITWKYQNLWYAYKIVGEEYIPTKTTFKQKNNYGWPGGEVIVKESKCK